MDDVKTSLLRTVHGLIEPTRAGRQQWRQGEMGELVGVETDLDGGGRLTIAGNSGLGTYVRVERPTGKPLARDRADALFLANGDVRTLRRLAANQLRERKRANSIPRAIRRATLRSERAAQARRERESAERAVGGL